MQRFEWADVHGPGATIWSDVDLDGVSEDGVEPGTVGVSMDTGSNGIMLWGERDALIAWAEDLAKRLRTGEGSSPYGELREFVFQDRFHLVQDADGDEYDAEQLDRESRLRDNSGAPVGSDGEPPELTGDLWQVMDKGAYGRTADGRVGFIVPARKVLRES